MTHNLLPIRILFHSAFALAYLPTIALAFVLGGIYAGLLSLSALAGLGIFAALDILNIYRKVNQKAFLCIDIFFTLCLPGCVVWPFLVYVIGDTFIIGDSSIPAALAATVVNLGLNTTYVLYLIVAAVIDKVYGNTFLPRYPDESPLLSSGTRGKVFLGRRRTPTEQAAVIDHCASYIFRGSVFRKHAFEPTAWAIFRGTVAAYCCVGLLAFTAYEGYSGGKTYTNGGHPVQETVLPQSQVNTDGYLLVAMRSPLWQSIPSDLTVSRHYWDSLSFVLSFQHDVLISCKFQAILHTWQPPSINHGFLEAQMPHSSATPPTDFNVSWSGDVTLLIWATVSHNTDNLQFIYNPGFRLGPFKEYDITLTIISYQLNGIVWLFLEPQIHSVVASGSNTTTAMFSCDYHYQMHMTHRDLTSPSGLALFAQALSGIGGVYAFIDGVFALIFGRTMLAILFGSKSISPFGLLGIVTRDRFRRLINEQYPRLQEDIERGGMAAYVSEVAVDPGLLLTSTSAHIRTRVAIGDDAEDAGLIPLKSMEPSNANGKSSHSQLQLPYAIEDYEPARKHDYK
ncbi:hypothetical protein FIBSPDRAFT_1048265 [Athelia psychrophila]|uniref:Uncharacterized protein n=1 Tax=Athelia psychrophila TaxID=1759441 RepID=A0A166E353_9AGAM|nr:hypothetical protein FIBSPDRAFT_1048265 [Fibularhizoctonia sp. CBS 109695]